MRMTVEEMRNHGNEEGEHARLYDEKEKRGGQIPQGHGAACWIAGAVFLTAAEICERLEGHNRNISILLDEIRKGGEKLDVPPNLDSAARLAEAGSQLGQAWASVYGAALAEGQKGEASIAFSRLSEITVRFETLTKGEGNDESEEQSSKVCN